jgi:hypothetical protein
MEQNFKLNTPEYSASDDWNNLSKVNEDKID